MKLSIVFKELEIVIILIKAKRSDVEITYQIMSNSIKPYIEKLWNWNEMHQQRVHQKRFDASKTSLIQFQSDIVGISLLLKKTMKFI